MSNLCTKCLQQTTFIYKQINSHVGEFCAECGSWQRWVQLEEVRRRHLVIITDPECIPLF
jgi:NMD protein affecting ribosome stability and mRNA decay